MLVWSEGEASSGEEGEPAASLDNWSNFARLEKEKIFFKHKYIYIYISKLLTTSVMEAWGSKRQSQTIVSIFCVDRASNLSANA